MTRVRARARARARVRARVRARARTRVRVRARARASIAVQGSAANSWSDSFFIQDKLPRKRCNFVCSWLKHFFMKIQQATPNINSYFKARARNGKMDTRVTANVL